MSFGDIINSILVVAGQRGATGDELAASAGVDRVRLSWAVSQIPLDKRPQSRWVECPSNDHRAQQLCYWHHEHLPDNPPYKRRALSQRELADLRAAGQGLELPEHPADVEERSRRIASRLLRPARSTSQGR